MKFMENLPQTLKSILEDARFAPSVHNTQPWKVSADEGSVIIGLDPEYLLKDGDPTGRETIISLGIFAEAVRLSAEARGYKAKAVTLHGKSAIVSLESGTAKTDADFTHLIRTRATDRSIYRPTEISDESVRAITSAWQSGDTSIYVLREKSQLMKIAELTSRAIRMAISNPEFRKELSGYLVLPWSAKKRGISVKSLYIPQLVAVFEPFLLRFGIGLNAEARLERKRWESASAVVAITAKGDMPEYWFEVGRAYLAVSLAIEKAGLAQATSAALVEASNYHEDIEKMLGTSERLQCMIRIGQGSKRRAYSPRVSAEALMTT